MRSLLLPVMLLLLLTASSCSITSTQSGASIESDTNSEPRSVPANASPAPQSDSGAPDEEVVSFPSYDQQVQASDVKLGVNILWYRNEMPLSDVELHVKEKVQYLQNLGANSMMISYPFYTEGPTSNVVFAGSRTPQFEELEAAIIAAKDAGLYVVLRPLMDQAVLDTEGYWRGSIQPDDRDAWFASYSELMVEHASFANAFEVDEFIFGAEFTSMDGHEGWFKVSESVERVFDGNIGYSNNWNPNNWLYFGELNIDAYYPVELPDSAPQADIYSAWHRWLSEIDGFTPDEMVLTEVGIASSSGLYGAPYEWQGPEVNLESQAKWFSAVCEVSKDLGVAGIYFWKMDMDQDLGRDWSGDRTGYFPRKPAEDSIRSCFRNW